jgi:hypothetical protein
MRDHGRGIAETLERLSSAFDCPANVPDAGNPDMGDLDVDDLWQVYYDSQYCPEKKNLGVFRQRMPRRDQDAAGLRLVQNKKEVTLEDFFSGKE